jgi:hypothetical protein
LTQQQFWQAQTIHKNTVALRLREGGMVAEALKLEKCHSFYTFAVCHDCGQSRKFPNRCDLFFCPECQPHLSHERQRQVGWWTSQLQQPKHVVLTTTNTQDLRPDHVDEIRAAFGRLRRRKFCRNWKGGFYSVEVTNEGRGWHLHLHILVDARWIDAGQLAREWTAATRGFGQIVKVKDCRNLEYLAEVTKYAVKGSQLASWKSGEVVEFVRAFSGKRTFGVFGSLYAKRTQFAEYIAVLKQSRPRCPCGSCNVSYLSEFDWLKLDLVADVATKPRPPPQPNECLLFDSPLQFYHD